MALSKDDIRTRYPIPAYNFRVTIDDEAIAFSQVSGLTMTFETSVYKESPTEPGQVGPVVMRMPAQHADVTITMQKGVARERSVPVLYNWINSIQLNLVDKKDIQIALLDENGDPVIAWLAVNAFPTGLEGPTFDASSNDVALESLTLMADRIQVQEI